MTGHVDPTRAKFGEFMRLADGGPIQMLNLVRFRAQAAYPDGRYLCLLTGLEPLGGYPYVWPWVADVAMPALLTQLAAPDTQAIVVIEHTVVWQQHDTRVYLAPLLELIEARYTSIGPGMYLSPAQARACQNGGQDVAR